MSKQEAKAMSKGQSQARTQPGRRILERCTVKDKTENVVFVDVDSSKCPDVIIIDVPETSQKRLRVSRLSREQIPSANFISLDDDDEEVKVDETSENGDESVGNQDSDSTSSKASCPAFSKSKNSEESDCDDCQIIREKKFPLTFSKSKRTYSGETFSRNRFGLGPMCDSSSSESDSSDCEFMDGPSGKIREEWERAALKRKVFDDIQSGQPGFQDQGSASVPLGEIPENVEVEYKTTQHVEVPYCSTSSNAFGKKVNPVTSTNSGDGLQGDPSCKTKENAAVADVGKTIYEDSSSCRRTTLQQEVKRSPLSTRDGNATHDSQNDIIGAREKFKETVEFKRAAEEEWASRQHQLKLQAEEAQRLRRRKKAEADRVLDMERRQKQRVEEMRETQKKNVDTINLKEQLRAEVRKELLKLELMHRDMASLLRGLDINVAGGSHPTPHEVHAAYKKALLRFHPDRASRMDIRQQVEAEEKFKLISRLKEKLLPTS